MRPLNLKLQIIEDEEFRNLVKELIKSQILNITREQIKDMTIHLIEEKRMHIQQAVRENTQDWKIRDIIKNYISEELGNLQFPISTQQKRFSELFNAIAREETIRFFNNIDILNYIKIVIKDYVRENISKLQLFQQKMEEEK